MVTEKYEPKYAVAFSNHKDGETPSKVLYYARSVERVENWLKSNGVTDYTLMNPLTLPQMKRYLNPSIKNF